VFWPAVGDDRRPGRHREKALCCARSRAPIKPTADRSLSPARARSRLSDSPPNSPTPVGAPKRKPAGHVRARRTQSCGPASSETRSSPNGLLARRRANGRRYIGIVDDCGWGCEVASAATATSAIGRKRGLGSRHFSTGRGQHPPAAGACHSTRSSSLNVRSSSWTRPAWPQSPSTSIRRPRVVICACAGESRHPARIGGRRQLAPPSTATIYGPRSRELTASVSGHSLVVGRSVLRRRRR
jgi:hypothetical protein